jgi:hypothetical protein
MDQSLKDTLIKYGVSQILEFDIDLPSGSATIDELEKEIEEKYGAQGNVIVNVRRVKADSQQHTYHIEVLLLDYDIPDERIVGIKALIELYNLRRLSNSYPDPEVRWRVKRFLEAHDEYMKSVIPKVERLHEILSI